MKTLSAFSGVLQRTTKYQVPQHNRRNLALIGLLVFGLLYPYLSPNHASATITYAEYVPDRMVASSLPSGAVCVKSGATTQTSMTITFPSQYTVDATTTNWTLDTNTGASTRNIPPGATAWPTTTSGNATAASNSTKAVTFTVGNLASSSTLYCLHFTAAGTSSNGSAGDNLAGTIATNADTAYNFATAVTSNDQLSVSATVGQTFSFSLTSGTHSLTLSPGGSTQSSGTPSTGTITTNAKNGYTVWLKSANAALHSATLGSGSDITAGTFADGTNIVDLASNTGYVLDCQNSSGTPCNSGNANFKGNATTSGGKLPATFQVVGGSGSAASADSFTLTARAKVGATQAPASDYADTITVTAAGQF